LVVPDKSLLIRATSDKMNTMQYPRTRTNFVGGADPVRHGYSDHTARPYAQGARPDGYELPGQLGVELHKGLKAAKFKSKDPTNAEFARLVGELRRHYELIDRRQNGRNGKAIASQMRRSSSRTWTACSWCSPEPRAASSALTWALSQPIGQRTGNRLRHLVKRTSTDR